MKGKSRGFYATVTLAKKTSQSVTELIRQYISVNTTGTKPILTLVQKKLKQNLFCSLGIFWGIIFKHYEVQKEN